MISLWRFFLRFPHEGPLLSSPFELARATPEKNSQRYQLRNYQTYFERWAEHFSSAHTALRKNPNEAMISYNELIKDHVVKIRQALQRLGLEEISVPIIPGKSNCWQGMFRPCPEDEKKKLIDYCAQQMSNFPELRTCLPQISSDHEFPLQRS